MLTELTRLDLRLRRRSLIGYSLGIAVYTFVIVALYPAFKNDAGLDDFAQSNATMAALFGVGDSLTSSSGWLNANLYANFLPLVVLLLGIGYGASCLAGQDEDGTLGVMVAMPISRRRIAGQKFAALGLIGIPVAIVAALVVILGRGFELTVDLGNLAGVTLGVLLLGICFGALAMLVGGLSGSRGLALGISSAVAAASYLINSLAPIVDWIRPARYASPFYYAIGDNQLENGLRLSYAAVLVAVALALFAAAVLAFERLDVH
ncbi:ABC transporter permease [Rhodococcus sp. WMMA185]|uniref:ABC transporter permease n=1 Tax=Rhodococcus sp. WMMA185 TaxID=679318 RepID=UPI000878D777|nr:ABC transporter permease subunit [Rhodococcus sp. WMMA185]AOW93494.1 ABC transporter permease [Rhodococcus sp. WMMA185]